MPVGASGVQLRAAAAPLLIAANGLRSTFRPIVLSGVQNVQALGGAEAAVKGAVKDGGRTNIKAVVRQPLPPGFAANHTHAYFTPGGGLAVPGQQATAGHTGPYQSPTKEGCCRVSSLKPAPASAACWQPRRVAPPR